MSQVFNMIKQKQINYKSEQYSTIEWTIQSYSTIQADGASKEEADKANVSGHDNQTPLGVVMQSNKAVEAKQNEDLEYVANL